MNISAMVLVPRKCSIMLLHVRHRLHPCWGLIVRLTEYSKISVQGNGNGSVKGSAKDARSQKRAMEMRRAESKKTLQEVRS